MKLGKNCHGMSEEDLFEDWVHGMSQRELGRIMGTKPWRIKKILEKFCNVSAITIKKYPRHQSVIRSLSES